MATPAVEIKLKAPRSAPDMTAPEPAPAAVRADADSERKDPILAHEDISRLAYSYWEARGCEGGSAEEDWYRAEAELRAQAD